MPELMERISRCQLDEKHILRRGGERAFVPGHGPHEEPQAAEHSQSMEWEVGSYMKGLERGWPVTGLDCYTEEQECGFKPEATEEYQAVEYMYVCDYFHNPI